MASDKQNTEIRQEQIARAALQAIALGGTKSLSLARIAQCVGLVPSAIYRHFGGKDEVIDSVLDLINGHLQANLASVNAETENAVEALRRLMNRHVNLFCQNDGVSTLIFSDQVYSGPVKRKAKIYKVIREYLAGISKLVKKGQQARLIRLDVEPGVIAVMFLGLVQPPAILSHLSERDFDVPRQTEQAWRVFKDAICPR